MNMKYKTEVDPLADGFLDRPFDFVTGHPAHFKEEHPETFEEIVEEAGE